MYPDEAVAAPLCALVYRDPLRDPCAPIQLADLRQVVIPRVVLVPADSQQNSPTRVRVLEGADVRVNAPYSPEGGPAASASIKVAPSALNTWR